MQGENISPQQVKEKPQDEPDFIQRLNQNPTIQKLPKHLKQFVVDQNYVAYTPIDHSVWRYVLRQNHRFLIDHAHEIYFEGLEKTGLKVEAVPSIEEMNEILVKIGWAAVTVDGFIPPAAFMEFQQHRVLVIAADMRQIHHIEYTPSPDIIHEAAGHAPVIADTEYAEYLRRFGEVGAKAMSSKKDYELYEAIRRLSILKETPDADPKEIDEAEKDVLYKQENLGKPSEMALLSRLHWWTVEYGLVGPLDNPKIYGAGILSSIGEAATCLNPEFKKIQYNLDTKNYAFDITTRQPFYFVTPDFTHLIKVLEEFADTMAFRVGGLEGIKKAIESDNTATCVYSSGLQVSGAFTDVITDDADNPVYMKTTGKTNLAYDGKELPGHDIEYHKDGFGAPIGKIKELPVSLEDMTNEQLQSAGINVGSKVELEFESGVRLTGICNNIERRNNKIILLAFSDCTVTYKNLTLFDPSWGTFDMAVGEKIVSVFSGAADKDAYDQPTTVSKTRVIKVKYDEKTRALHILYQKIRDIREKDTSVDVIPEVWEKLQTNHQYDWLLPVEIYEILSERKVLPEIRQEVLTFLNDKKEKEPELKKLIDDGIYLAENPLIYH